MKNSTGIVMQKNKSYAFIMTESGEFLKIKTGKIVPNIGEIYTGEVARGIPFYKYTVAASLLFVLLFGTASYAYYTPTSSVVIDISPSIELKINRWNRIIKTTPLNSDGEKVLSSLEIKNKTLSDGLDLIVEGAKKDNFIDDAYIQSGKAITVSVEHSESDEAPDLTRFEENTKKNNLKVNIVRSENSKTNSSDNPDKNNNKENKQQKDKKENSKAPTDKDNSNNGKSQNDNKEKAGKSGNIKKSAPY